MLPPYRLSSPSTHGLSGAEQGEGEWYGNGSEGVWLTSQRVGPRCASPFSNAWLTGLAGMQLGSIG